MNNENVMECSSRIKLERQKRSWTQEQLAERAKLSARTIQRIECGSEASAETLRLIAEALGVTAESLRAGTNRSHFDAPWCRSVKVVTAMMATLLACLFVLAMALKPALEGTVPFVFVLGIILACYAFSVAGYSIRDGRLLIHRQGWATPYDLSRLSGFEINSHAMMGSVRLFGVGGLFGYVGVFRNAILGRYRAFVTDHEKAVVLEFGDRKIVVSPDSPAEFIEALHEATKGTCCEPAQSKQT